LLIAAGLLTRNLQKLQTIDTGLVTKNVFTLGSSAQGASPEPGRMQDFRRQLAARLRALPGVRSVSLAQRQPLSGPIRMTSITLPGRAQPDGRPLQAGFNFVSADYFQTLGLRITRGRGFTPQEEQAKARVILISESTARHFWPNEDPIGKLIGVGATAQPSDSGANFPQYEVIGVTNDTRQGLIWRRDETFLYVPLSNVPANTADVDEYVIVNTEGDPRALLAAALKEAATVDAKLSVLPRLVEDSLALEMSPFKAVAALAGALGMLALVLASIGLYGVMSFIVSQRMREIGIRMALGAGARDVIALFLRQGAKLITIGVAIGLAGGAAISALLAAALTDISQFDLLAFGLGAAFLTVIALLACYIPARRATKVDPMVTLRHE
jgi:putative ABC transport system permease protein